MYSAESIIAALKTNKDLSFEGIDTLGCPSSHEGCNGVPDNCELCINQKCKQPISVYKKLQKLIVLNIIFMISTQNHGGFIRKDDSMLKHLIDRKLIDKSLLKPI